MAEVKWIKLYTDMNRNKKIKRIRKLPEGNNIVLIWCLLLLQAGESNKQGALFLTDAMPFTVEDLAIELDFDVDVIRLALAALEKYQMIQTYEDVIYIRNWDEYQNIDGLEKIKEQNRERKQRQRLRQKEQILLEEKSRDCHVTGHEEVTQRHATDIDLDKEKDIDIDKDIHIPDKSPRVSPKTKTKYGEYKNVLLTEEEFMKLQEQYSNLDELIKYLDEYIAMKGYKAKSHYLCIKKWVVDAVEEKNRKNKTSNSSVNNQSNGNIFDQIGKERGYW